MERIRITYEKFGALRYTSHLDMQKMWVRALLRAKIPLAYTQGFHPTPKLSPAWPLPLGWAASGELIDFWIDDTQGKPLEIPDFVEIVNRATPPGLKIAQADIVPCNAPSLTGCIQSACYQVAFPDGCQSQTLRPQMENLMAQSEIIRERRGKPYDLKAMIEKWQISDDPQGRALMLLQMPAKDSAMGRPDEVVDALGYDPFAASFTRTGYLF